MAFLNLIRVGTADATFAGEPWAVALAVGMVLLVAVWAVAGSVRQRGEKQ